MNDPTVETGTQSVPQLFDQVEQLHESSMINGFEIHYCYPKDDGQSQSSISSHGSEHKKQVTQRPDEESSVEDDSQSNSSESDGKKSSTPRKGKAPLIENQPKYLKKREQKNSQYAENKLISECDPNHQMQTRHTKRQKKVDDEGLVQQQFRQIATQFLHQCESQKKDQAGSNFINPKDKMDDIHPPLLEPLLE